MYNNCACSALFQDSCSSIKKGVKMDMIGGVKPQLL